MTRNGGRGVKDDEEWRKRVKDDEEFGGQEWEEKGKT